MLAVGNTGGTRSRHGATPCSWLECGWIVWASARSPAAGQPRHAEALANVIADGQRAGERRQPRVDSARGRQGAGVDDVQVAEVPATLAARDHILSGLIAQAGPMPLWRLRSSTHFVALVLVRRQPIWPTGTLGSPA
jgi:hypothetical protein